MGRREGKRPGLHLAEDVAQRHWDVIRACLVVDWEKEGKTLAYIFFTVVINSWLHKPFCNSVNKLKT